MRSIGWMVREDNIWDFLSDPNFAFVWSYSREAYRFWELVSDDWRTFVREGIEEGF